MKDPKQSCRDRNIYSYQAYKGAEAAVEDIKADMLRILTEPSEKTVYEQIRDYFELILP